MFKQTLTGVDTNTNKLLSDKKSSRNSLEAVRILTGSSTSNIFSVRVRDRGPDYRGFVEVPIIQGLDGTSDPSLDASFIAETTARCFVEACGCHKVALPVDQSSNISNTTDATGQRTKITLTIIESCLHIKHAVKCTVDSTPLTLKNSALNLLPITNELREEIWMLARDTPGPLVQRASKITMVVKCKTSNKHPLGYIHCSFAEVGSDSTEISSSNSVQKFYCSCKAFKTFKNNNQNTDETGKEQSKVVQKKCVHYYACICAFASDESLTKEFSYYIKNELPQLILEDKDLTDSSSSSSSLNNSQINQQTLNKESSLNTNCAKRMKRDDELIAMNTRRLIDRGILNESDIKVSFVDWLSSVTELINHTMHFQLNGHPEPLTFKIPQSYFDCLQQRIATGLRKKRLPNVTTVFTRKDFPPFGTFTKYTYCITNIIHVKQIFDTAQVPLEITQNFIQNRDGTYDYLNSKSDKLLSLSIDNSMNLSSSNNLLIKPSELKTYLKVGLMSPEQKEATPFIIEWIPDILPKCQIGELKIQFQYGHLRNGKIEKRD